MLRRISHLVSSCLKIDALKLLGKYVASSSVTAFGRNSTLSTWTTFECQRQGQQARFSVTGGPMTRSIEPFLDFPGLVQNLARRVRELEGLLRHTNLFDTRANRLKRKRAFKVIQRERSDLADSSKADQAGFF